MTARLSREIEVLDGLLLSCGLQFSTRGSDCLLRGFPVFCSRLDKEEERERGRGMDGQKKLIYFVCFPTPGPGV